MANYKVFHLKDGVDQGFFLKPRPRYDKSIAETYCISKKQLVDVEENRETHEVDVVLYMKNIAKNCMLAWEAGEYVHVADVKAKDIVQVLRNTNNINGHWFLTVANGVNVVNVETERSTCGGDVIEHSTSGDLYMVYGYTFINIKTGALIE